MTDENNVIQLIKLAESYGDVSGVKTEKLPAPPDREDWLRMRKHGIGGSDAAAVLGLDPYRTALDVYHDKLSDSVEQDDNPHMKRGRKLERLIIAEYAETHPEDTVLPAQFTTHEKHPWMHGTPDGLLVTPHKKTRGIIEVKCPAKYAFEKIKLEGIPTNYVIQMQHYLAITGLAWGRFVIFNADSWEMITVDVDVFSEKEQANYITALAEFWNEHVIPQVPPEEDAAQRVVLPKVEGRLVVRNDEAFGQSLRALADAQADAKGAASFVDAAKANLLDVINSENGVYENDEYRVYYTPVAGRVTFDKKALAAAKPIDPTALLVALAGAEIDGDTLHRIHATLAVAATKGELHIDLSQFEKRGDDFSTLRIYPKKKAT
jgi:putative phage-type endonuclease